MSEPTTLKVAVERTLGAPAEFVELSRVIETFRGEVVWDGVVKMFETKDAQRCYAWPVFSHEGARPQFVTVLKQPPIQTAVEAVRAWIVSTQRK